MLKVAIPRKYNLRDLTVSQPSERERERERARKKSRPLRVQHLCSGESASRGKEGRSTTRWQPDRRTRARRGASSRLLAFTHGIIALLSPSTFIAGRYSSHSIFLLVAPSLSLSLSLSPSIPLSLYCSTSRLLSPLSLSPSLPLSLYLALSLTYRTLFYCLPPSSHQ